MTHTDAAALVADQPGLTRKAVAILVADGLTDKAIAGRLGLSAKTVEYHIARLAHEWRLDPSRNIRVQITRILLESDN